MKSSPRALAIYLSKVVNIVQAELVFLFILTHNSISDRNYHLPSLSVRNQQRRKINYLCLTLNERNPEIEIKILVCLLNACRYYRKCLQAISPADIKRWRVRSLLAPPRSYVNRRASIIPSSFTVNISLVQHLDVVEALTRGIRVTINWKITCISEKQFLCDDS